MDLDAYVLSHRADWNRLADLTEQTGTLTGAEADEVVTLYQRTATHLSVIRASAYDPELEAKLSALVTDARSLVTGSSVPLLGTLARFFTVTFPGAVYALRWGWIAVGVASIALAFLIGYRVINEPGLESSIATPGQIEALINHDFAAYYSENPAFDFAFQVWLNNSVVTATVILLGITVFPVLLVWYSNISNLGVIGGIMVGHGRPDVFYGLLLPHGMLELTCIFIGIAAGLTMAWAWISPGRRTRARALAEQGRSVGAVALGLALVLAIAGILEAFITPSQLPAEARLAIGAAVWVGFLAYIFTLGRRAALAGETGDVAEADRTQYAPTEAA